MFSELKVNLLFHNTKILIYSDLFTDEDFRVSRSATVITLGLEYWHSKFCYDRYQRQ